MRHVPVDHERIAGSGSQEADKGSSVMGPRIAILLHGADDVVLLGWGSPEVDVGRRQTVVGGNTISVTCHSRLELLLVKRVVPSMSPDVDPGVLF